MKPHLLSLLLAFSFVNSCGQADMPAKEGPTLDKKALAAAVDDLVQQYIDIDLFSGVVLLADQGKPFYEKAFGMADRERGIPNTVDTRILIGSMNKTFTRVVILQLIEEGKLKMDDPLGKYLSGFPKEAAEQITIAHLLEHRSGYGDYLTPEFWELPREEHTIAGVVELARTMPLHFPPGEGEEYSNLGYVLLGAIIEKVTGRTYGESVQSRIVDKLQLKDTDVFGTRGPENEAVGHRLTITGEVERFPRMEGPPRSDGGFLATARDIFRFYQSFHFGTELLSAGTRAKDPLIAQIEDLKKTPDRGMAEAGGFDGGNTVNLELPGRRFTIVVLANMGEPVAEKLAFGIQDLLLGRTPEPAMQPAGELVYKAFKEKGATYVKANFDSLTVNFHARDPKDMILNSIGYDLLFSGQVDDAIAAFTLNTELFPDVANCWDSLGEAWLKKGDRKKALTYYSKALELDPRLPSAVQAVKELAK